jgi:predicted Fe-Mo cluster-binding NifX family protein
MRIAVASTDGTTLSPHFGRSQCFIVYEVADGKVVGREVRDNHYTAHAAGECREGDSHAHDKPHSHEAVVSALRDCAVVLCGGMGWRAAEELKAHGIQPLIVNAEGTPDQTVEAFLAGRLRPGTTFCRCHS